MKHCKDIQPNPKPIDNYGDICQANCVYNSVNVGDNLTTKRVLIAFIIH